MVVAIFLDSFRRLRWRRAIVATASLHRRQRVSVSQSVSQSGITKPIALVKVGLSRCVSLSLSK